MLAIAHCVAKALEPALVRVVHLYVGEQRHVITGAELAQMSAQNSCERKIVARELLQVRSIAIVGEELHAALFMDWSFIRKAAGFLVGFCKLPGDDLAGLNVGLIESVDAENGSCDCSRNLPAEDFLAHVINVGQFNFDDRLATLAQRVDFLCLPAVGFAGKTEINEDPIIAVDFGRREYFAVNGNETFAQFARTLRQKLLQPRSQVVKAG